MNPPSHLAVPTGAVFLRPGGLRGPYLTGGGAETRQRQKGLCEGRGAWSPGCSPKRAELSVLPLLAPQVKALGCDGSSPPSVPSWLDSLGLQDYVHSFLSSGYSSIDTVKNLWELELVNVSAACAQARPGPQGAVRGGWGAVGTGTA